MTELGSLASLFLRAPGCLLRVAARVGVGVVGDAGAERSRCLGVLLASSPRLSFFRKSASLDAFRTRCAYTGLSRNGHRYVPPYSLAPAGRATNLLHVQSPSSGAATRTPSFENNNNNNNNNPNTAREDL